MKFARRKFGTVFKRNKEK